MAVLLAAGGVSLLSLIAALVAEVAFVLEPCIMCIYQRIPFIAVILFTLIAIILRKRKGVARLMIAFSGLAFLANSVMAFYHTGIELKWWVSKVEGCAVPHFGDDPQSMLDNILSAPTGRCDEIPWADPIFGLSMANYNIILCLGLFLMCAVSLYAQKCSGNARCAHSGEDRQQ